MKEDLVH